MKSYSSHHRIAGRLLVAALVAGAAAARAQAQSSLSASVLAARDDQGYLWDRYQARWDRQAESDGQRLSVGWHRYALDQEFAGVRPFAGGEPAIELGGHLLRGLWWTSAAVGLQGEPAWRAITGELVLARAFLTSAGTFTPRLEAARTPLALAALPLSLGLLGNRGQALLNWRTPGWVAEGGLRVDLWDAATVPGRVRNGALDRVEANRITILHGYLLTQRERWVDFGLAAKAAWARHNTLLATQLSPGWQYSWYPASAPPFAWETALVVRAQARPAPSLAAALQLSLPVLSRETRQWEAYRESAWGTAPFEGKLEASWFFLASTAVQIDAAVFAKPWEGWKPWGAGAYRQATVGLSLKQRI
jgi:hypothetical protein